MNTNSEMREKLGDPEYRSAFVQSQINIGIPFQIRALRKERGWTQPYLAQKADMKQSRISAIEKPGGPKLNIDTLCRLASAFDVALDISFVPFGELVRKSNNFDPDSFTVKSFDDEIAEDAPTVREKTQEFERVATVKLPPWLVNAWETRLTVPPGLSPEMAQSAQFLIDRIAYNRWREFANGAPSVAAYLDAAKAGPATAVQRPYVRIDQGAKAESVNWDLVGKESKGVAAITWKSKHHRGRGNRPPDRRPASGRAPTQRQASR